jgi:hypothetical protein
MLVVMKYIFFLYDELYVVKLCGILVHGAETITEQHSIRTC